MVRFDTLTLTVQRGADSRWVGECKQLGLVAAGPDHLEVWSDLLNICSSQIAFAIKHHREDGLLR